MGTMTSTVWSRGNGIIDEIMTMDNTTFELFMGVTNTRVNEIDGYVRATVFDSVATIERGIALIDTIDTPRNEVCICWLFSEGNIVGALLGLMTSEKYIVGGAGETGCEIGSSDLL